MEKIISEYLLNPISLKIKIDKNFKFFKTIKFWFSIIINNNSKNHYINSVLYRSYLKNNANLNGIKFQKIKYRRISLNFCYLSLKNKRFFYCEIKEVYEFDN